MPPKTAANRSSSVSNGTGKNSKPNRQPRGQQPKNQVVAARAPAQFVQLGRGRKLQTQGIGQAMKLARLAELNRLTQGAHKEPHRGRTKWTYDGNAVSNVRPPPVVRYAPARNSGGSYSRASMHRYLPDHVFNNSDNSAYLAATLPLLHTTRYVAGYTAKPTAVASPYTVSTVDVTSGTAIAGAYLSPGCYWAAVSRDPLNAIMEYVPNQDNKPFLYEAEFSCVDAAVADAIPELSSTMTFGNDPYPIPPTDTTTFPITVMSWKDSAIGDTAYAHPHGDIMFTKVPDQNAIFQFTWLDKGSRVTWIPVDTADVVVSVTNSMNVWRWNGVTAVPGHSEGAGSWDIFTALHSGYYAFTFTLATQASPPANFKGIKMYMHSGNFPTTVVKNNVTLSMTDPTPSFIAHRPMIGITDRLTLTTMRVNGASIMVTPDAQELAKGGIAAGIQLTDPYMAESFLINAAGGKATDTILSMEGVHSRNFEKGIYGWHKPYSEKSYDLQTPFRFNLDYTVQNPKGKEANRALSAYHSLMCPPDGWTVVAVNTEKNALTGTDYPGGIMHTTWAFSVEYMTNDVWISRKLPLEDVAQYTEVMRLLAHAPQFTENDLHIGKLMKFLRSTAHGGLVVADDFADAYGDTLYSALRSALKHLRKWTGPSAGG